jgi:hypothetical protein
VTILGREQFTAESVFQLRRNSVAENQWTPLAGTLQDATERQAAYAATHIRLFKSSFTPSGVSPLADFVAAEADYDTYASIAMATWDTPILAPGSGYMIGSPLVQFAVGPTDPVVGNVIGGYFVVDSGGKLRIAGTFEAPIAMQVAGQGIPINLLVLFPTNF